MIARADRLLTLLIGMAGVLAVRAGTASAAEERSEIVSPAAAEDDYDPWAPFNRRMFSFNHGVVDRFLVKPAATVWDRIWPQAVRRGVSRAIDNLKAPRRVFNNLLQGRLLGAGTEAGRIVINTTVGVGGFLDIAGRLHLEGSDADMGETLGVWGLGPGPYLVLPFLAPFTVRDGAGRAFDTVLDPLWLVPFLGGTALNLVNTINDRSLHLRLFADVEESTLDLYSAVRNGYLQRRRHVVAERQRGFRPAARALIGLPAPGDALGRTADGAGGGL